MGVRGISRRAARPVLVIAAAALGAGSSLLAIGPPAVAVAGATGTSSHGIGPYAGLEPAFTATFDGTSLNTSVWDTCYPSSSTPSAECTNFGNSQEEEWYLPSQDQVSGGTLHMVADAVPTSGTTWTGAPKTYSYRSGMVTTYSSFSFTYGYVRVVAKLPGGTGTWPALWLLPKSQAWPPEIDVMENWGTTSMVSSTLHWVAGTGTREQTYHYVTVPKNLTTSWNTYAVLWQPGSLTFYVDTAPVHTITGSEVPDQPMYFLANLAIDGPAPSGSSFDLQSVQIYDGSSQPASGGGTTTGSGTAGAATSSTATGTGTGGTPGGPPVPSGPGGGTPGGPPVPSGPGGGTPSGPPVPSGPGGGTTGATGATGKTSAAGTRSATSAGGAGYDDLVASLHPSAWWKLATRPGAAAVVDSSGHGRTGTAHDGAIFGKPGPFTSAPSDTAAGLSGTGAYVSTPLVVSGQFSAAVWVRAGTMTGGWPRILSASKYLTDVGFYVGEARYATKPVLFYDVGNGRRFVQFSVSTVPPGWNLVVLTYGGTEMHAYLDGTELGSEKVSFDPAESGLLIGGTSTTSPYFPGTVAEVAVFPTVLSSRQVEGLYASGSVSSAGTSQAASGTR